MEYSWDVCYRKLRRRNRLLLFKVCHFPYLIKLKRNRNIFDDTNLIVNPHNVRIAHTKWGRHSGIGDFAEVCDAIVGKFCQISSNVKIGVRDYIHHNFTIHDMFYDNREFVLPGDIDELDG